MANLITLLRFCLLFVLVAMAYWAPPVWQQANAPLLVLIIGLDGLDGYVARVRGETSIFGSIFDIAVDRVVENVLWIVLGHIGLVPIWVAIVFIVRGAIVDSIRYAAISRGESAFGMMRSALGRTLVAGRAMRGLYGVAKAATFAWVLFFQPWPTLYPQAWERWADTVGMVTLALVLLSVALCILRGVPVVAEFIVAEDAFRRRRFDNRRHPARESRS
ncbi:MAG: CDP-alcohol phosphatidyltransferase family protein [Rhodospirillales bacterium]|nr:MAG: CDP-alcohol phosphatidyltransferase family protein [Rhodospirillales bacterium]